MNGRGNRDDDAEASEADDSMVSGEVNDCSTGNISALHSSASSTCSPATSSGMKGRLSTRRSLTDLSHSARMTPKGFENRGMGVVWATERGPGLCTMGLNPSDVAEKDREFCLLPTPELCKHVVCSSPRTPDAGKFRSPGAMQRRFVDRVQRASLSHSPVPSTLNSSITGGVQRSSASSDMSRSRLSLPQESCSPASSSMVDEGLELPASPAQCRHAAHSCSDMKAYQTWGAAAGLDVAETPAYTVLQPRAASQQPLRCEPSKAPSLPAKQLRPQRSSTRMTDPACASSSKRQPPGSSTKQQATQKENERPAVQQCSSAKWIPMPSRSGFSETKIKATAGHRGVSSPAASATKSSRQALAPARPLAAPLWGGAVPAPYAGLRRGSRSSTGPYVRADQRVPYQN